MNIYIVGVAFSFFCISFRLKTVYAYEVYSFTVSVLDGNRTNIEITLQSLTSPFQCLGKERCSKKVGIQKKIKQKKTAHSSKEKIVFVCAECNFMLCVCVCLALISSCSCLYPTFSFRFTAWFPTFQSVSFHHFCSHTLYILIYIYIYIFIHVYA